MDSVILPSVIYPRGAEKTWLNCPKREITSPDLWASLSQEKELIAAASGDKVVNESFTKDQLPQVLGCLGEIKRHLITSQRLTEEHQRIVEARFDYLDEAATRLGRKDWLNALLGVLLSTAVTLGIGGDGARDLFSFAANTLRNLLGQVLFLSYPH